MKFIIVGRSASGKDALRRALEDTGKFRAAKTCTTRKPRVDDVSENYTYLTPEQMQASSKNLICRTTINGYEYGLNAADVVTNDLFVLDPSGVDELATYLSKPRDVAEAVFIINVRTDNETRMAVAHARGADENTIRAREASDAPIYDAFEIMLEGDEISIPNVAGSMVFKNDYDPNNLLFFVDAVCDLKMQHDNITKICNMLVEANRVEGRYHDGNYQFLVAYDDETDESRYATTDFIASICMNDKTWFRDIIGEFLKLRCL